MLPTDRQTAQQPTPEDFAQIDHNGFIYINGTPIKDNKLGSKLLQNLHFSDNHTLSTFLQNEARKEKKEYIVEAYDSPLVVQKIEKQENGLWQLTMPYEFQLEIDLHDDNLSLALDSSDRFHGFHVDQPPFILSKEAHFRFFSQLDEFDDDSITTDGKKIQTPYYFSENQNVKQSSFWSDRYEKNETGWDLGEANPVLVETLTQLKLVRSRVLVLGCGLSHDAAHFAQSGHLVTAIDFSPIAIEQAKQKYGHLQNIEFICADIFEFLASTPRQFDMIFEHTCFCAIAPQKRSKLASLWSKVLFSGGHLLGIFFVNPKRSGPPFGSSEWEIQKHLDKNNFRNLYWTRCRNSVPQRLGHELVTLAQKKSNS